MTGNSRVKWTNPTKLVVAFGILEVKETPWTFTVVLEAKE